MSEFNEWSRDVIRVVQFKQMIESASSVLGADFLSFMVEFENNFPVSNANSLATVPGRWDSVDHKW